MNLGITLMIYAGGPGSGCNPEAGECGRHKGPTGPFRKREDAYAERDKRRADGESSVKVLKRFGSYMQPGRGMTSFFEYWVGHDSDKNDLK